MARAAAELHASGTKQAVGRSKFCQKMRPRSRRESDVSVTARTLPRQAIGEDVTGGGEEFVQFVNERERKRGQGQVHVVPCSTVYTILSLRHKQWKNGSERVLQEEAARCIIAEHVACRGDDCANIHKQRHVIPGGCLDVPQSTYIEGSEVFSVAPMFPVHATLSLLCGRQPQASKACMLAAASMAGNFGFKSAL